MPSIADSVLHLCRGCWVEKPGSEFYRDRSRPRGRVARCKTCYSDTQKNVTNIKPYRREGYAKGNARKRGIEYGLTREQFMSFWQKPCSYCGDQIETIGLDRIDNAKGYVMDNVVPCCGGCNGMKSSMSREAFIERCRKVTANACIATGNAQYR